MLTVIPEALNHLFLYNWHLSNCILSSVVKEIFNDVLKLNVYCMAFKCWGLLIETQKSILKIFDLKLLLFIDYILETKVYKEGRLKHLSQVQVNRIPLHRSQ